MFFILFFIFIFIFIFFFFLKVEWMSDLDVRSLGMVASRMLTNYIKSREREQMEKGEAPSEEEEHFDPNYLEASTVLRQGGRGRDVASHRLDVLGVLLLYIVHMWDALALSNNMHTLYMLKFDWGGIIHC